MNTNYYVNQAITEECLLEIQDGGILCSETANKCLCGLVFHVDFFNPGTGVTRRISVDNGSAPECEYGYHPNVKNIRVYPVGWDWRVVDPCTTLYEVAIGSGFYVPYEVYREAAKKREDRNRCSCPVLPVAIISNPKAEEVALRLAQKKGFAAEVSPSQVRYVCKFFPETEPWMPEWKKKTNWVLSYRVDNTTRHNIHFSVDSVPVVQVLKG